MNQFVSRVLNNFVNEVVVEGLAKSRTFQRFAVATDATLKDVQKASTEKLKAAFEDIAGEQQTNVMKAGPPIKPLSGFPGFVAAFIKEVRKDLGGG